VRSEPPHASTGPPLIGGGESYASLDGVEATLQLQRVRR